MALKLNEQNIYLSNIERKKTETNGKVKWFITARGTFNSSYNKNYADKNAEPDWVKDKPFFVDVACFNTDVNKIIGTLTEGEKKGGSLLVSGKIVTDESTGKDGKKYYNTLFIISSAKPVPVKEKPASEAVTDVAKAVSAADTDDCPF